MMGRSAVVWHLVGQLRLDIHQGRLLQPLLHLHCFLRVLLNRVVDLVFRQARGSKSLLLLLVGQDSSVEFEGVRDVRIIGTLVALHGRAEISIVNSTSLRFHITLERMVVVK